MDSSKTIEIDNLVIGLGAAGCACAKLMSLDSKNKVNLVLESHFEPGGCAGYFARGKPRRLFDVGATQLVECEPDGLQTQLFELNSEHKLKTHQISDITFHFPHLNTKAILNNLGELKIEQGFVSEEELKKLKAFFKFVNNSSLPLWKVLRKIPKYPIQNIKELVFDLSLFFKLPLKTKFLLLFAPFLSVKTMTKCFGLNNNHLFSFQLIDSLLLDTAQTTAEKTPLIVGLLGLSILHKGIYRCDDGMHGYFKPISRQIVKNGTQIHYGEKVKEIEFVKDGFLVKTTKQNLEHKYFVKNFIFLNTTIWNAVELINANDCIQNIAVLNNWKSKSQQETGWGAFALYGYFLHTNDIPNEPYYHQIFPLTDEPSILQKALYVSIYQKSEKSDFRFLTATIHCDIKNYKNFGPKILCQFLLKRIEESVKIKVLEVEFATPNTFEKYTQRSKGQVGGLIANFRNFIFNPVKPILFHKNKKSALYLIGDSVFPGQGVISSTVSGISAYERIFQKKM